MATVLGTVGADTLTGGAQGDAIDGLTGDDTLTGGGGDDTFLFSGREFGTDVITDFSAGDRIDLSALHIADFASLKPFLSQVGNDSFITLGFNGSAEIITLKNVALSSLTANAFIFDASAEAVTTDGTAANDVIFGGAGDDHLYGHEGDDHITGGAGNDIIMGDYTGASPNPGGSDIIDGGAGDDQIFGGNASDIIHGGDGNDWFFAGGILYGDAGDDYIISFGADAGRTTIYGGAGNDTLTIQYYVNDGGVTLDGGEGADTLIGGGGNDTLNGGTGVDNMYGGQGGDTYYYTAGDTITEGYGEGHDTVISAYSYTMGQYIEYVPLAGGGNLKVIGNLLANTIIGNSGDNIIDGGANIDTLIGGLGNDTYYVDNFHDVVSELKGEGMDTVISSVQYIMGGSYVENARLTGSLNSYAVGNALDNILFGNTGNNNLTGGAGNDRLDGGAGSDGLRGGLGNDVYYVDNLGDFIVENKGEGTDLVYSTVSFNLGAQYVENLTLRGTDDINGLGNALANTIIGNSGDNRLDGRAGNDTLTGGGGADIFLFTAGSGQDTITDFQASQNDSLNLHAYNQAAAVITQVGADTVIDLGGGNIITLTGAHKADVTSHITW